MKTFLSVLAITLYLVSGPQDPKPDINQLSWLAGYWTAEIGGTQMEELWLPVSGNMMIGLHRDTFSSGRTFFEYLRIEQTENGISYSASPGGKAPTEFRFKELAENRVIFENPDHDFPQRIIYRLEKDTVLVARIEGEVGNELRSSEWRWHKTILKTE